MVDVGESSLSNLRVAQVEIDEQAPVIEPLPSMKVSETSLWVVGKFLRGPIPLSWLGQACRLTGEKALATALAIWFLVGLRQRKHDLSLSTACLELFGVLNRSAKYRAITALEKAGLIRVERKRGKNPLVTILDAQPAGRCISL
jgi:hypothetical protein